MNITNVSNQIYTHDFRLNGEWEVSGTNADWNITILGNAMADGYSHVVFTLHLRRRYRYKPRPGGHSTQNIHHYNIVSEGNQGVSFRKGRVHGGYVGRGKSRKAVL